MRMYDIIDKKREKGELTKEEIRFFLSGFAKGEIPDYQASALLMAICCNGMTDREILDLTQAMAASGDTLDLSSLENTVDKHSTGRRQGNSHRCADSGGTRRHGCKNVRQRARTHGRHGR